MRTRRLGSSDLEITEISLGSWLTYSGGVERDQAEACTRAAFDAGINFFDTANAYGDGAAESAWGEILSAYPRADYMLATKVFFPVPGGQGLSAEQIHKQIDASLGRLQTDYVDLYQCHRFDVQTPIEETMEALADVVKAGKARYIGFSEWMPEQIEAGMEAAVDGVTFVSSQPQYSMLWRASEDEVFPLMRRPGDLPDRLVAAGRGRADRQVRARQAAARATRARRATRWASSSGIGSTTRRSRPCSG